jgi:hypothetical protein
MPDASGLPALGRALDEHLIAEYSPPPGTQTALGFLAGVAVNPDSFVDNGVVNPLDVNTFLDALVNKVAPVVDGRFAGGLFPASQLFEAMLAFGTPVAPPGTPAADAFAMMKGAAGSAYGVFGAPHDLVTAPANWYDPAQAGWSQFSVSAAQASGSATGSSSGQTPPVVAPTEARFERLWRWRTIDPAVLADVVTPAVEPPVAAPAVRDHRTPVDRAVVVRDHRTAAIRDRAVIDRGAILGKVALREASLASAQESTPAAEPAEMRLLATAPRLQLANIVDVDPILSADSAPADRSQEVAQLLDANAPTLIAALDGDGETSSTQSVESSDLTLSMEYCLVELSRSAWWNDVLVRMPGWYAPQMRAGDLVPTAALAGKPVGVPVAMVLTRNVTVTGHWSEADRSAAASHTSFGPWHIGATELEFSATDETASLTIPGMQVVAVICSLLPTLPPVDDPALPPPAG